jgi:hypothetical protein
MSNTMIRLTSVLAMTLGFVFLVSALSHTFYFDASCAGYPSGRAYSGCVVSRLWLTFAVIEIVIAAAYSVFLSLSLVYGPDSKFVERLSRDRYYYRQTRAVYIMGNLFSFLTFFFTALTYAVGPQAYHSSYRWGDTWLVIFSSLLYSVGFSFPFFEARQGRGPFEPAPATLGQFTSTDKFTRPPQGAYVQQYSVSELGAGTRVVGQPSTYSGR